MRLLLGIWFIVWASMVSSEVIDIRSGEHEGFTRLVFNLETPNSAWEISGSGRSYVLKLDVQSPKYSAESVFERIPRTRLATLGTRDGDPSVTIGLMCECGVEAFAFGDRSIVIDIRTAEEAPVKATEFKKDPAPELVQPPKTTEQPVTVLRLSGRQRDAARQKWTGVDDFLDETARIRDNRNQLVHAVARAASQGLVEPNIDRSTAPVVSNPVPAVRAADALTQTPPPDPENIRTGTSYDTAFQAVEQALSGGQNCVPDAFLDVGNWSEGRPDKNTQESLASLFGEDGKVDEEAAFVQAQLLLHKTFGAEARQILDLLPPSEEKKVLAGIADIMDSEKGAASRVFADQDDCSEKAIFWAFLAETISPDEAREQAILRAFSALPKHLRLHLGPRIAERFLTLGNGATADTVSAMIDRVAEESDTEALYLKARIEAQERGQEKRAETALSEMVQQGERIAPEALIDLVELYDEQGITPSMDVVFLLEAFVLEHRRSELGPDLRRTYALSSALSGDFKRAFDVAQEVSDLDGEPAAIAVRSQLLERLLESSDDAGIVRFAIGYKLGVGLPLTREASLDLAERLHQMGFYDQSQALLEAVPFHMTERERVLLARQALSEARPRQAIAELLGIESEDAQKLRADALAMAGEHVGAAMAYNDISMKDAATREAWLAEDWGLIGQFGTPHQQDLEGVLSNLQEIDADPKDIEGQLARNRRAVERSTQLREQLGALLAQDTMSGS